jgi:hypothetical protein
MMKVLWFEVEALDAGPCTGHFPNPNIVQVYTDGWESATSTRLLKEKRGRRISPLTR